MLKNAWLDAQSIILGSKTQLFALAAQYRECGEEEGAAFLAAEAEKIKFTAPPVGE